MFCTKQSAYFTDFQSIIGKVIAVCLLIDITKNY